MMRRLFIAVPFGWLVVFLLVPCLVVLKISLSESVIAQPPYAPLIQWLEGGRAAVTATLASYGLLLQDDLYVFAYLNSLKIAAVSTILALLVGYPIAYGMARAKGPAQLVLLLLIILPFWSSFLIRVYAWKVVLQGDGILNTALLAIGVIDRPVQILYSDTAVYLGIVYSYLPFMVLPLYASLQRLDYALIEAARDLGGGPVQTFLKITLPLSLPGIVAGVLLVFIPAVGEFVIPELLGGPDTVMIGRVLWNEFFANRDWPAASAVAMVILLMLVVPIALFQRSLARGRSA